MQTETLVDQYRIVRVKESDNVRVLTHLDRKEGKLYIRVLERNTGATPSGIPTHTLSGLTIFEFPLISKVSDIL